LVVFAAASLTDALREAAREIEASGGPPVKLSFGSSGALARQIAFGAPADVFVSANSAWVEWLVGEGVCRTDSTRVILRNSLVVVVPQDATTAITRLQDLAGLSRIVLANTRSAPAGIYAREALKTVGVWESMRTRIIEADNVRAALVLVARGEADAAIVYATDALACDGVKSVLAVPQSLHGNIEYMLVAIERNDAQASIEAWVSALTSERSRNVFLRCGFEVVP
jgi:molybdate transport system substrate-binding protein